MRKGKRGGHVYTKIIPDASIRTLIPIIESKVACEDLWLDRKTALSVPE